MSLFASKDSCKRDVVQCQLIRKQATQLKFISEAPKLKINKDERVLIPDLSDLETPKCVIKSGPVQF
jgi:uncharacterized protein (DUF362 family)